MGLSKENETIRSFVRFESDKSAYSKVFNGWAISEENDDEVYCPTCQDIVNACNNMINAGINIEILKNWYYSVFEEIAESSGMPMLSSTDFTYLFPEDEDTLFHTLDKAFFEILWSDSDMDEKLVESLKDVIRIKEDYDYNIGRPEDEWRVCALQKEMILNTFARIPSEVPGSKTGLLKRLVEEGCMQGNYSSMIIKAYGCYGGNNIYDCDWKEAEKWLVRLFETDGNPHHANSLGNLYYYGKSNNGVPDYEKAFRYYSIGAAYNLTESMYRMADMFLEGKGCIKSPEAFDHIVSNLYDQEKPKFQMGDKRCKFAQIALRMTLSWLRENNYENALLYCLPARYAIEHGPTYDMFSDEDNTEERIKKCYDEIMANLPPNFFKDKFVDRFPFWLFEILSDHCTAGAVIKDLGDNRYILRLERRKKGCPSQVLITIPELGYVNMTDSFEVEIRTKNPIDFLVEDRECMSVNNVYYCDENGYCFCLNDEVIFTIPDAKFIVNKKNV